MVYIRNRKLNRENERFLDTLGIITESLEGSFEQLEGKDVIQTLATFIKEQRINHVIVGESPKSRFTWFSKRFSSRLLEATDNANVTIIRNTSEDAQ